MFRSSTPLVIALLDYAFLGRELPSLRSWASLLLLLVGAFGYVMYDANFEVTNPTRSTPSCTPLTPTLGAHGGLQPPWLPHARRDCFFAHQSTLRRRQRSEVSPLERASQEEQQRVGGRD